MSDDHRSISQLTSDPRNARRHTPRNIGMIVESLQRFGAARGIVVDEDGTVLAGNGVLEAAAQAGIENVRVIPVDGHEIVAIQVSHLTADQKRQYAVADNRTTELSEWNTGELQALLDDGVDLSMFWFDEELDALLASGATEPEALTDPDAVPADPEEPITKPGDVWLLGRHRVMCGDATSVTAVERLTNGDRFDLLMTDPPYGIDAPRMTLGSGKKQFHRGDWDGDRIPMGAFVGLATHTCIWGGNYYADLLPVTNHWLAWHKKNDGLSFSEFELAWTDFGKQARLLSHHWSGEVKAHPTQKPVAVIKWAMDLAPISATVIDLFGGSGTTLIACEQTNRAACLMELDPRYCDVIVSRWEQLTGQSAIREEAVT